MSTVFFNSPVTSDTRTAVLQYIRDYQQSQARMFDGDTLNAAPVGTFRWNAANTRFERWDGSVWNALALGSLTMSGALNLSDNGTNDRTQLQFIAGTGLRIWNKDNTNLSFGTSNTERMRIDANGTIVFNAATAAQTALMAKAVGQNGLSIADSQNVNADQYLALANNAGALHFNPAMTGWVGGGSGTPAGIVARGTAVDTGSIIIGSWSTAGKFLWMNANGGWTFGAASSGAPVFVTLTADPFPVLPRIGESTHATSRRSGIELGTRWAWVVDSSGSGTRNFFLYDGVRPATPWEVTTNGNHIFSMPISGYALSVLNGSNFSPSAPSGAALRVQGSFGGGIVIEDTALWGWWADAAGANLRLGSSPNSSAVFTTRLTLNNAGEVIVGDNGRLQWGATGVGAPTFTNRSAGLKLLLYPEIGGSTVDYGIGIEGSTMWFSVPTISRQFRFYGGTTAFAELATGASFDNSYFDVGTSGRGRVRLNAGTTSNPGYVAWFTPDGNRRGYLGWIAGSNNLLLQTENSWGLVLAPVDERLKFNGSSSVFGATTIQGDKNGWGGLSFRDSGGTFCNTLMARASDGYGGVYNKSDNAWLVQWDGSGNFTATGNVTAYSDERLKKRFKRARVSLEDIIDVGSWEYTRRDNGLRQIGVKAQEVRKVMPLVVNENDDGYLSVDYGRFATAAVLVLAREVKQLKERLDAIAG